MCGESMMDTLCAEDPGCKGCDNSVTKLLFLGGENH